MKATKIKMRAGCANSNNLCEIDQIYLSDCAQPGFYRKEDVHDRLRKNPGSIKVNIFPFPNCVPAVSIHSEKYVKSSPNSSRGDNLLELPRY